MRLGDHLLARGLLRPADLDRALDLQAAMGGRLGQLLVRIGALSEDQLLEVLSEQLSLPVLGREAHLPQDPADWGLPGGAGLSPEWMLDQQVLLWCQDDTLYYASRDPIAPALEEALAYARPAGRLQPVLASGQAMERALGLLEQSSKSGMGDEDVRHLRELAEEAPVVELVNNVMSQAVEQRASDIHLEPGEHQFVVRFRIDGVLYSRLNLPRERGHRLLREDGLLKAWQGVTSVDEVLRVIAG